MQPFQPCRVSPVADGIIARPGLRLVTGVEALAAVLHPGTESAAVPVGVGQTAPKRPAEVRLPF